MMSVGKKNVVYSVHIHITRNTNESSDLANMTESDVQFRYRGSVSDLGKFTIAISKWGEMNY